MAARNSKAVKSSIGGVFESVEEYRNIIVSGSSFDPLDVTATGRFVIPAGTPMAPIVSTGKYMPIRRSRATSAVSNDTTVTVDCVKPFLGQEGAGVLFYASNAATATLRTISTVTQATNVIVLTAAATVVDDDYFEVALNGAHGNVETATPTQIPDAVILAEAIEVVFADGTTFDVPAVGVIKGAIARENVNGPGVGALGATFDVILKNQLPNISFLPVSAGTA